MIAAVAMMLAAAQVECDPAGSQIEINECIGRDYARADAALNRQWRLTLEAVRRRDRADGADPRADSTAESRLRAAQRAWILFRDAHCDSVAHATLALQIEHMQHMFCLTELTTERTRQLAEIARAEEDE